MPASNTFLSKVLQQSSVSKTPEGASLRSEVSRSHSRLQGRIVDLEAISESDNQESNETSEGDCNFTTDYSKSASSVGQVSIPEINPPPPPRPEFAVPLARAPKSRNSASERFVQDVKMFYANEFMSQAKKDYIICKLSMYIIKKCLEKSHGESMVTRRKKEEIFQSFIESGLMMPADVESLLNAQFPVFDVASIASCSVHGRNVPCSVFSNLSSHPYQHVPLCLNCPQRNMESVFENSLNPPRMPVPIYRRLTLVDESRVYFDPLSLNNTRSSRNAQQGFRISDEDLSSTQVTSSSAHLPSSVPTIQRSVEDYTQVPPKRLQETQSKENVKPGARQRSPSPISRPRKRKLADSSKKAVALIKKDSRPQVHNDSIANHSITRSGRISTPVIKYEEIMD